MAVKVTKETQEDEDVFNLRVTEGSFRTFVYRVNKGLPVSPESWTLIMENLETFLGFQLALYDSAKKYFESLPDIEKMPRAEFEVLEGDDPRKKSFYAKRNAGYAVSNLRLDNLSSPWNIRLNNELCKLGYKNSTGTLGLRVFASASSALQKYI